MEYRDRHGRIKPALVTGTTETIREVDAIASGLGIPAPGNVHLLVFSPSGSAYAKYDIPQGEGPSTWSIRA